MGSPLSEGCVPMSRDAARVGACATLLLMVALVGCTLGASKQPATPPAPQPAAVQPPAPEPPLSVPQTAVTLPGEQEFNPDSIPKVQTAAQETPTTEKPEAPPAPRVVRRPAAGPPKPDAEPETETPASPAPAPAVQAQEPILPILSAEEQNRIKIVIEGRKREINDKLGRPKGHLSTHDQSLVDRIRSFLTQCDQAAQRGDYSQADTLSERALVLAREFSGE